MEENYTSTTLSTDLVSTENSMVTPHLPFCGPNVKAFADYYLSIDVYISAIFCVSGVITNIFNLRILTTRSMRSSPINRIFTALALTDLLCVTTKVQKTIFDYGYYGLPYVFDKHRRFTTAQFSYYDTGYIICYALVHTWSIYLTLTLGLWRYMGVMYPLESRQWLTVSRAKWAILASLLFATLLIPCLCFGIHVDRFNVSQIIEEDSDLIREQTIDTFSTNNEDGQYFELVQDYHGLVILLLIHTFFIKMGPCVLMSIITLSLIRSLRSAKRLRIQLFNNSESSGCPAEVSNNGVVTTKAKMMNEKKMSSASLNDTDSSSRTNKILIMVLAIFVVTECPMGILNILSMIYGPEFFYQCEIHFIFVFALFEYISSTTSFWVYYVMGKNFRMVFHQIFCGGKKGAGKDLRKQSEVSLGLKGHKLRTSPFFSCCNILYSHKSIRNETSSSSTMFTEESTQRTRVDSMV